MLPSPMRGHMFHTCRCPICTACAHTPAHHPSNGLSAYIRLQKQTKHWHAIRRSKTVNTLKSVTHQRGWLQQATCDQCHTLELGLYPGTGRAENMR